MEFDINDDPMAYEARPIFGYWTRRQAVVGACVIVLVSGLSAIAWRIGADAVVTGAAAACVGAPAGYLCLSRRHGLLPEEWMPIARRERDAPAERVWAPPRAHVEGPDVGPGRLARRRAREAWGARRGRPVELEGDSLLDAYLGRDDDTTDPLYREGRH